MVTGSLLNGLFFYNLEGIYCSHVLKKIGKETVSVFFICIYQMYRI